MPKVSVIVPIYNVEKYLERCLESLVKQTFQDIEIICVNDCSLDNSQKIIEKYKERYPQMIKLVINQKNCGLGKSRERGIQEALGTYIMCVDSDDYVDEDWVEEYVSAIESENDLDMVIGGYLNTTETKEVPQEAPNNKYALYMCVSACCRIYRKSFLIKNNISFGGIRRSEDCFWTIQIAIHNPRYLIIDNVGYHYCINSSSITRGVNKKNNQIESELDKLHEAIFQTIDFSAINKFQRDMIEYTFISNTFAWLFFYNRKCGISAMRKKYKYTIGNLKKYFPEFKKNSMIRFGKVKAGGFLCRSFVSVELFLYKIGLGKVLYYLRAVL